MIEGMKWLNKHAEQNALLSLLLFSFLALPSFAFAQTTSLQTFLINIVKFINNNIIPMLFTIALLIFIWNVFRFFVIESAKPDGREKAKRHALYSIIAFVFLVSIWGIVNMFVNGFGLYGRTFVCPDYMLNCTDTQKVQPQSGSSGVTSGSGCTEFLFMQWCGGYKYELGDEKLFGPDYDNRNPLAP
jgi:hypothetical protein